MEKQRTSWGESKEKQKAVIIKTEWYHTQTLTPQFSEYIICFSSVTQIINYKKLVYCNVVRLQICLSWEQRGNRRPQDVNDIWRLQVTTGEITSRQATGASTNERIAFIDRWFGRKCIRDSRRQTESGISTSEQVTSSVDVALVFMGIYRKLSYSRPYFQFWPTDWDPLLWWLLWG